MTNEEKKEFKLGAEEETANQEIAPPDEINENSSEVGEDDLKIPDEEIPNEEEAKKELEVESDKYAKELERLKVERDNYKEGMLIAKKKLRSATLPDFNEEELAKKITDDVLVVLEERERKNELKRMGDFVEEVLASVSVNESEKELIKYHYDNSIKISGTSREAILADIETAKILANKQKIIQENEELSEMVKSFSTRGAQNFSGQKIKSEKKEPKLSDKDQKILNAFSKFGAKERYTKEYSK
jgi:hypothetical protein